MSRKCSVTDCARDYVARGWCDKHYRTWKKYGDPSYEVAYRSTGTVKDRFYCGMTFSMYCWDWSSSKNGLGYGLINKGSKRFRAHRVSYELYKGTIPKGLVIDHKCHNPGCVNPMHLQAVSQKQNTENPKGPKKGSITGVVGVSWDKARGKYLAGVGHKGKRYVAGRFEHLEDAEEAVKALRNKLFTNNLKDRYIQ